MKWVDRNPITQNKMGSCEVRKHILVNKLISKGINLFGVELTTPSINHIQVQY